jgi:hypothetical protein
MYPAQIKGSVTAACCKCCVCKPASLDLTANYGNRKTTTTGARCGLAEMQERAAWERTGLGDNAYDQSLFALKHSRKHFHALGKLYSVKLQNLAAHPQTPD